MRVARPLTEQKVSVSNNFITKNYDTDRPLEGFKEIIDNAIDANATKITINYDDIDHFIDFIDDGIGFMQHDIKKIMTLGTDIKTDNEETIGTHGVGFKAAISYLINTRFTSSVKVRMISARNGLTSGFEWNCGLEECMTYKLLPQVKTEKTGTTVHVDCVFLSKETIDEIKLKLRATYYHALTKGFEIVINGEKLQPIDMFYRNVKETEETGRCFRKEIIRENLNGKPFDVQIFAVNTAKLLRHYDDDEDSGFRFDKENINDLDNLQIGKVASTEHTGIYIELGGKYLNLGGPESLKHIAKGKAHYLKGYRVEIRIPLSLKRYITNAIKSMTRCFLPDIVDDKGNQVFQNTIKFLKQNPDTKSDPKKEKWRARTSFYRYREDIYNINNRLKELTEKEISDEEFAKEVRKELGNLFKIIDVCVVGKKSKNLEN